MDHYPGSARSLERRLRERRGTDVTATERGGSIVLEGEMATWMLKIEAGWTAARYPYRNVVNDIQVPGIKEDRLDPVAGRDGALAGRYYDVAIIGGGVVGAAIARELSRWDVSVVLLEKENDVAVHTSSRNDGMIHDGFAARPGTKKAHYNVRGNRLWEPLCRELGIEFKRPGSLMLFSTPLEVAAYPLLADRARRNGVDGWEYWSRARVFAEEPNVAMDQHGGFFLPSAGVLSPYKATIALVESAILNGANIELGTWVTGMELESGNIARVVTNRGTMRAGVVVNAAGNWADVIAGMAGDRFFSLHQRRGTDVILDATTAPLQHHIMGRPSLSQARTRTKGGGLVMTVEGNILVGPTAHEMPGREDYETRAEELEELTKHVRLNTRLSMAQAITYFSGVRPCTYDEDFIIERSQRVSNLVHAAGIQSPGLASAPAIAQDIAAMALERVATFKAVRPRTGWLADRPAAPEPKRMSAERRSELIAQRPAYGRIVCRCEEISEGEVIDAATAVLPATNMDAVKRRTRAGMGRCHGGFCTPRVMEILVRETGGPLWSVTKKGPGSEIGVGPTKGARP
jgi:glycerol-3-phosphate dehydrogenase